MKTEILKTDKEKKEFLENDFIERIIRIEQRVSAKYGALVPYKETYCYKNLTPENKKRYEKYLKTKKTKKFAFAASFLIPLFGILFISKTITGNVIGGTNGLNIYSILLIGFILISILIFISYLILDKRKRKRVDPLFKPLENLAKNKSKKDL